jgi:GDP-L-fucose synthase
MSDKPAPYSLAGKRVWVAGHTGMVGSAVARRLAGENCTVMTTPRQRIDLRCQAAVDEWMAAERPEAVFLAAATVGGILANDTRPAEFIYDNLAIQTNIVHGAWKTGVEKLLLLGSACIYPKLAAQPMAEEALLTGPLEPTNEWYAVAKIAGIKMCQAYRKQYGCDFISAQPVNLYGPGDNFDLASSHVIPALIAKTHQAKVAGAAAVEVWGTGSPLREFLYVDDLADALVFLMRNYSDEWQINIGTGEELTIRELAERVIEAVGFDGELVFDASKPDGMPRKLLDARRLHALGWAAGVDLNEGLRRSYDWYLRNVAKS